MTQHRPYYKTLALNSNKKYLKKISKSATKILIISFSIYECNLCKVLLFSIWLFSLFFINNDDKIEHRKKIQSITEQELDKLRLLYVNSEQRKFNLRPTTEKK